MGACEKHRFRSSVFPGQVDLLAGVQLCTLESVFEIHCSINRDVTVAGEKMGPFVLFKTIGSLHNR